MSERDNQIRIELPDEAEAILERRKEIEPYLLDATQNYPEPYFMLEYKGTPFSTIGGIQALSGQKKNGKTFLMAQMMAANAAAAQAAPAAPAAEPAAPTQE